MLSIKNFLREKRKKRIRSKIFGVSDCPRLSVFRSNTSFSAQLIDDSKGVTITSALVKGGSISSVKNLASILSEKYNGRCVFDRNGFLYSGKIKVFAEELRSKGFDF